MFFLQLNCLTETWCKNITKKSLEILLNLWKGTWGLCMQKKN